MNDYVLIIVQELKYDRMEKIFETLEMFLTNRSKICSFDSEIPKSTIEKIRLLHIVPKRYFWINLYKYAIELTAS